MTDGFPMKHKQPANKEQSSMYADIRRAWLKEIRRLRKLEKALVRAIGAPAYNCWRSADCWEGM